MDTSNKPKNQKPNGLHDLGQIPKNANPWVIVEKAGTDEEDIFNDFPTYCAAMQCAKAYFGPDFPDQGVDIVKRLDDGTLTTEF